MEPIQQTSPFLSLPPAMRNKIMGKLDARTLVLLGRACRATKQMVHDAQEVWKGFLTNESYSFQIEAWKAVYCKRALIKRNYKKVNISSQSLPQEPVFPSNLDGPETMIVGKKQLSFLHEKKQFAIKDLTTGKDFIISPPDLSGDTFYKFMVSQNRLILCSYYKISIWDLGANKYIQQRENSYGSAIYDHILYLAYKTQIVVVDLFNCDCIASVFIEGTVATKILDGRIICQNPEGSLIERDLLRPLPETLIDKIVRLKRIYWG